MLLTRRILAVKAVSTDDSEWEKPIQEAGLKDETWLGIRNALKLGKSYSELE